MPQYFILLSQAQDSESLSDELTQSYLWTTGGTGPPRAASRREGDCEEEN